MGFWQFKGKRYPFVPLNAMTARDVMTLQTQIVGAEYTSLRTVDQIIAELVEIGTMPKDELSSAVELHFCTLVQLWAAMRATGERLAIADLVDASEDDFEDFDYIKDTGDPAAPGGDDEAKPRPPSTSGAGKRRGGKRKKSR